MKHALHLALLVSVVCLVTNVCGSSPAQAGPMDNARFALHAKPFFVSSKTIPNLCPTTGQGSYDPNFEDLPCRNYTLAAAANQAPGSHVFLVIGQLGVVGINGASCGVDYNTDPVTGVANDFIGWTACADGLEFPNDGGFGEFPKPKGGVRITWANCQTKDIPPDGVHAVVGAFYVYAYSEDVLKITPNNNLQSGPELVVADCGGSETDLLEITAPNLVPLLTGAIHFGGDGQQGYTPCGVVATKTTTWGNIKNLYNDEAGE